MGFASLRKFGPPSVRQPSTGPEVVGVSKQTLPLLTNNNSVSISLAGTQSSCGKSSKLLGESIRQSVSRHDSYRSQPPIVASLPVIASSNASHVSATYSATNLGSFVNPATLAETQNEEQSILNQDEEWEAEMARLRELERLEVLSTKHFTEKPTFGSALAVISQKLPGISRIPFLQMLERLDFEDSWLRRMKQLCASAGAEMMPRVVELLSIFMNHNFVEFSVDVFSRLSHLQLSQCLSCYTPDQIEEFIEYMRHSSSDDSRMVAECIASMDFHTVLEAFRYVEEYYDDVRHCAHCRTKRNSQLDLQLRTSQWDPSKPPLLGLVAEEEKAINIWTAADQNYFSVDFENGRVLWQNYEVDLVQICDACLQEVHQFASIYNTDLPLYQMDATQRKEAIAQIRAAEEERARLVVMISDARRFRRLHEFAIKMVRGYIAGMTAERKAREVALQLEEQRIEQQKIIDEKQHLVDQAMMSDSKWIDHELRTLEKNLQNKVQYTTTVNRHAFSVENLPPDKRVHSTTWDRQIFDENGLPLTEEAASIAFGLAQPKEPENHSLAIQQWKDHVQEAMQELSAQRRLLREAERLRSAVEMEKYRALISDHLLNMERMTVQMALIAEENEASRMLRRQADRDVRRKQRFAHYMESERYLMIEEDIIAHKRRLHEMELTQQLVEREAMFNAELEQREIDRFWGIDTYHQNLRDEEERLRRVYDKQIEDRNSWLRKIRATDPNDKPKERVLAIGTLPEDHIYMDDQGTRRLAVIRRLKGEEIRVNLKSKLRDPLY